MKESNVTISTVTLCGVMAVCGTQDTLAQPKIENIKNNRPNVIFILLDDAGYGDFGCYGQTKIETPNIDALAERGIRFTDMYAGAPVSAPSRCTLMTGLHSGHAQIRSNDEMLGRGNVWSIGAMEQHPELEGQYPMQQGTTTIASVMREAGYKTAMVGKWGLGGPESKSTPLDMGFDYFYGYLCQRMAQCYYPPFLYNGYEREYTTNPKMELGARLDEGVDPYSVGSYAKFKGSTYSPDAIYERMERFIEQNRDDNFFLMWTTTIPHSALTAPDEWVEKYVYQYASGYELFLEEWRPLGEVLQYAPFERKNITKQLKAGKLLEHSDTVNTYVLQLTDVCLAGDYKPIDYVRKEIEDMILSERRVEFIRGVREELYNKALEQGKLKRSEK